MHKQQTAFENIVGKEEIARNEQFLLFTQCFSSIRKLYAHLSIFFTSYILFAADFEEPEIGISGKRLKLWTHNLHFYLQCISKKKPFEIMGKRRKCRYPT